MPTRIYIATRKGLFIVQRPTDQSSEWSIGSIHFLGDPVTMMLPDRRDQSIYAALNLGHFGVKLHRSIDEGRTWNECATPCYPSEPEGEALKPGAVAWNLNQIWCLETGGSDQTGQLWAGTLPGGLFSSYDYGASWELNRSLWDRPERYEWQGGGYDYPGIHSICVNPRDSQNVSVAVSCGGVWISNNNGSDWHCDGTGLRAAYMPPDRQFDPNIQDPHRMVQSASHPQHFWIQHHNGIFRSIDSAATWQEINNVNPSSFGFAVVVHPLDPDIAWFVPAEKDERRVPVGGKFVVTRTRDAGQTFETLTSGLPATHAYDLVYRHGLDIDPAGNTLAMGSSTGSLWLSDDQGDHWRCLFDHLPPIYCVRIA